MQPAFFDKKKRKKKIVKRAKVHKNMGRIKQGTYGDFEVVAAGTAEFRGCAVGCLTQPISKSTIVDGFTDEWELNRFMKQIGHKGAIAQTERKMGGNPYSKLEEKFNFSEELSRVIDAVFEQLSPQEAKEWPLRIVEAIPVGADISGGRIVDIVENSNALSAIVGRRFDRYDWNGLSAMDIDFDIYSWDGVDCEDKEEFYDLALVASDDLVNALSEASIASLV
jgi:hypothetical protein